MVVENRENLEIYGVVKEVGRKTREGGRRERLTSNRSCKTQRPSETVASCRKPEPRYGRRGTGSGRAEVGQRSAKTPQEFRDVRNGGDMVGTGKRRRQESVGSVPANPDNLENSKKAEREAKGTRGLMKSKNCTSRDNVSPLSRLIRSFRNKYLVLLIPPSFFSFFFLISLIADGTHHYHPACGHKGSSHLSPVHALQLFIAIQVQHSYNSSTSG